MPIQKRIAAVLLVACCLTSLASFTPASMAATRGPILIDGNHQFNAPNGVVSGAGTAENPFIIKNWVINASAGNGIEVRNTNMYFVIRNCTIIGSANFSGISFYSVRNGAIEGCSISGGSRGIDLDQSQFNTITGSNVSGNAQFGIRVWNSPNNTMARNTISGNGICGIGIDFSSSTVVSNNTLSGNGEYGINIDSSANNTFTANSLTYSDVGTFLGFDTSNTLTNNSVSQCSYGIYAFASENRITGGSISGNAYGIYLKNAPWNIISNCSITRNTVYGIFYEPSENPTFVANAEYCWWGSPDGPSGAGPGSGDSVSTRVDFDPWRTAPWGYIQEYFVVIESSSGGATSPASSGWYASGATAPISATPSANYTFANWTATGGVTVANPTSRTTTFRVTGNGTVRANFNPLIPTFTVIFSSEPGGATNPSGSNSYPEGVPATIAAMASPGHKFTGWTVVGNATISNSSSASTTITVHGPANVTAHFVAVVQYSVVVSHSLGGVTNPSGSAYYEANQAFAIVAAPYPGYRFANWTATGSVSVSNTTSAAATLTVSGPGMAYAFFRPLDVTPPVISGLAPSSGSSVPAGQVTIRANFTDDTAVDPSSVTLRVDWSPVASGLQVTPNNASYSTSLQPGNHTVELTVGDTQGNQRTATWSFTVVAPAFGLPLEYIAAGVVAAVAAAVIIFFVLRKKPAGWAAKPDQK